MVSIVTDVADLGKPDGGTVKGLRLPSGEVELMVYDKDYDVWIGHERWTMRQIQNEGQTAPGGSLAWKYPGPFNEQPNTRVLDVPTGWASPLGFAIHTDEHGGEKHNAGLILQEHLVGEMRSGVDETGELPAIALAWYHLAQGQDFLSPDSINHGIHLTGSTDQFAWRFHSTGWQTSIFDDNEPGPTDILYPEVYLWGPATSFRNFTAKHRWSYGNMVPRDSGEVPSRYPHRNITGWWEVGSISAADGTAITEWTDYSGRGQHLVQRTTANKPVVMSETGRRFVRFDGVNDVMKSVNPVLFLPPWTIIMVMRQRASGGAQQVWYGTQGSGPLLIYRGDATDQVNVWAGGSDSIYHHSGGWPSGWMVLSIKSDGTNSDIWENQTEVLAATGLGTAGASGISLGGRDDGTLPAAIDVAEVILSFDPWTDAERSSYVQYLMNKYAIT